MSEKPLMPYGDNADILTFEGLGARIDCRPGDPINYRFTLVLDGIASGIRRHGVNLTVIFPDGKSYSITTKRGGKPLGVGDLHTITDEKGKAWRLLCNGMQASKLASDQIAVLTLIYDGELLPATKASAQTRRSPQPDRPELGIARTRLATMRPKRGQKKS